MQGPYLNPADRKPVVCMMQKKWWNKAERIQVKETKLGGAKGG